VKNIESYDTQEIELSEISEYEKDILDNIIEKFSLMTTDEIVQYAHEHLDEWKYANGSSHPISYETILLSNNIPKELVNQITSDINYFKSL